MSNDAEQHPPTPDDDDVVDRCSNEECDDDLQYIFPQRLMSILSKEKNHDAISWLPHGRAFVIRNRKLFAEKIMPRFFPRKSQYSSFTRKLNRWNFLRVSSGPELGAYYHEFFLRDRPHLAAQMFCKNARSKIAMANDAVPKPTPPVAAAVSTVLAVLEPPSSGMMRTPPPARPPKVSPPLARKGDVAAAAAADAAAVQSFLRGQRPNMMDPTLALLLKQHFRLSQAQQQQHGAVVSSYAPHNRHLLAPRRLQPEDNNYRVAPAAPGLLNVQALPSRGETLSSFTNEAAATSNHLWRQIQAQKELEDRIVHLRQLMAMNTHKHQSRNNNNNGPIPNNFRASAA